MVGGIKFKQEEKMEKRGKTRGTVKAEDWRVPISSFWLRSSVVKTEEHEWMQNYWLGLKLLSEKCGMKRDKSLYSGVLYLVLMWLFGQTIHSYFQLASSTASTPTTFHTYFFPLKSLLCTLIIGILLSSNL